MKRNYYRYLCKVAYEMNEDFRYSGSTDKAIVANIDGKLKIVVLRKRHSIEDYEGENYEVETNSDYRTK